MFLQKLLRIPFFPPLEGDNHTAYQLYSLFSFTSLFMAIHFTAPSTLHCASSWWWEAGGGENPAPPLPAGCDSNQTHPLLYLWWLPDGQSLLTNIQFIQPLPKPPWIPQLHREWSPGALTVSLEFSLPPGRRWPLTLETPHWITEGCKTPTWFVGITFTDLLFLSYWLLIIWKVTFIDSLFDLVVGSFGI